ncbi:hypothetical protein D1818_10785 [Aquimarina sp. BL5]|uniref:hypothetical protein n=1 Tax=Aquimarina sp. BL5 TaxID=1714860 RepID=UPI000E4B7ABD|nr:hypothetical protein [Aquimarina sp. BL5]AXT51291.1 hypothetical protein D1818_10785 [Aquimarina sp. BL5]RKN09502.1 hypothetical protein D7036_04305 [Aquimarina sp. BL5]
MKEELNISDLRQVIRNLITFIVVDGKEYVDDDKKREYVSSYVLLLVKIVNQLDSEEQASLIENISEDISNYMK